MRLRIPIDQAAKLKSALAAAGWREIGGQLFGEQLAPSDFLASEIAIQNRKGSIARFFVDLVQAARDAAAFFDRTRRRYTRFNYIGEWHSHPSFSVSPSVIDRETMRKLVADPDFRGSFAVLMIVRFDDSALVAGAWLFDPAGREMEVELELAT